MSTIKKVAIAGATGNLGSPILTVLLESKLFEVTVLTRKESAHKFPAGVTVKTVEYKSESSLVAALQGQDALVSTLPALAADTQKTLVDAAISAGVQRFIPSEFGSNSLNARVAKLPQYKRKIEIHEYLKKKAAETPTFSYTLVFNGVFLDWALATGIIVDIQGKKVYTRDGGDVVFSATRLSTVGRRVVGILSHPKLTRNQAVFIKDIDITQNELIAIAKEIQGERE